MYKNNVSKQERKEKIYNILTTSKKKKISTLPLTKKSYTNSPPKDDYSHDQPKLLPLFVMSDKGWECQVDISSVELASPSVSFEASSSSPSSSSSSSESEVTEEVVKV